MALGEPSLCDQPRPAGCPETRYAPSLLPDSNVRYLFFPMGKARWHPVAGEGWVLLSASHPIAEVRREGGAHPGKLEEEWIWVVLEPGISERAAMACDAQSCAWRVARDSLHPSYFE